MLAALRSARVRKLAGLAAVLALHVAIGALLLHVAGIRRLAPEPHNSEIIWYLPPPQPPMAENRKPAREHTPTPAIATAAPDYRGITIPEAQPDLGGLNSTLFACSDPEKLSPEERKHCAGSEFAARQDDTAVDFHDHVDRSRLAALWEFRRQRKNAPLLLPCMDPHAPPGISLATLYCLAKGAAEGGFRPDEQPSYADKRVTIHIPNGGDPPDGLRQ
jgi:hypothetical protein